MGKTAIKFWAVTVPVALVLIWWLSADNSNRDVDGASLTDAIDARADALRVTSENVNSTGLASGALAAPASVLTEQLGAEQSTDLQSRFAAANELLQNDQLKPAISAYKALIEDYPSFVEPYVNLASALAKQGKLEQARLTLKKSVDANQSTQTLYRSMNTLHGALAAVAYRNALETEVPESGTTDLPVISTLATDFALEQRIALLEADLEQQNNQQASLAANESAAAEKVSTLQAQVKTLEAQLAERQSSNQAEQTVLRDKIRVAQEKVLLADAELAALKKQVERVESDLVAKLRIELANKESQVAQFRSENADLATQVERLNQNLTTANTLAAQTSTSSAAPSAPEFLAQVPETASKNQVNLAKVDEDEAIALVESWAKAWSAQDVDRYVGFYESNYTPHSALTHAQWLEQRRVRLTNKSFIEVKVDDFDISATNEGFSVTFSQHYRSNTLDDTITKRLNFSMAGATTAGSAKIARETIVQR